MGRRKKKPKKSLLKSAFSNPITEKNPVFWTAVGGALTVYGGPLSGIGFSLVATGFKQIRDDHSGGSQP